MLCIKCLKYCRSSSMLTGFSNLTNLRRTLGLYSNPLILKVNTKTSNSTLVRFISQTSSRQKNELKQFNDKEVYYGVLTPQIRAVKVFSLTTSVMGIIAQPILYHQVSAIGSLPVVLAISTFVGFFTFVTPLLLHLITRKYITQITYNEIEDKYTATLVTFFLQKKLVKFSPDDVEIPDIPGMFTSFHIRGKPVFVDPRLFPEPEHYAKIMGYDKPIDFKLGTDSEKDNSCKEK